ncbi:MAG: TlpA family protein disulfide reductase [Actinomycetota bacterium]
MRLLRHTASVLALGLVAAACTSGGDPEPTGPRPDGQVSAQMASSDHYVGAPQRVAVGLVLPDQRLVSFGSVDLSFSYVGTAEEEVEPQPGPGAIAVYLPTPGTADGAGGPAVTLPSEARGVYQAEDVTFDRAGFWQVDVTAEVEGLGALRASTAFAVLEEPRYPAPGDRALRTENLTVESDDAPPEAIDSRAVNTGEVPDPELHEWTISEAVRQGRPALVVFSTPVYCVSEFCGPVTEVVEDLASRYDDRAVFIHVEIWRDHVENTINQGAADWLFRDGTLTEPWLYLIGPDGTIVDRWATLWREEQVVSALEALPRMEA